jgi:hypothetical protein
MPQKQKQINMREAAYTRWKVRYAIFKICRGNRQILQSKVQRTCRSDKK